MNKTEIKTYKGERFDGEREFYGCKGALLEGCVFEGERDGESAFKEAENIEAVDCSFRLRYPFWHNSGSVLVGCELSDTCRAPFWYSRRARMEDCRIFGTKAVRECKDIVIERCRVISDEMGWSTEGLTVTDSSVEGFYFAMRAENVRLRGVDFKGKYSFQYVNGGSVLASTLDTKDAFWHAKGVYIKDSVIKGEYLAWYSEDITFENCVISGTQPFCYCKGLKLINCELHGCDLAFEKSEVLADITTHVDSIKNPAVGRISAPSVGEIIRDDPESLCEITVRGC